ncbi:MULTISPECIES: MMPL family transporter [unclassified Paenibacillus]|uniref:MMPL family transporter n=1 Tax=unclassified Paenibacillus TaxID=185978 RepID=UPI001AE1812A|nr:MULTISPECIES: MMPL family transporter [unclassified Paenibacillus]MBP1156974.1 RND superfamily putative drug exporter [Paenibacillus sp. PvP091]MBP1172287.1 RND superfamily putative drug exporter [Paenibacillus sp. PvR098]MBP2438668.1 RND superfamily putative drug exporter [Paenibacillus sp. PvP052]
MGYQKLAFLSLRYPKTIIVLWALFLIFFGLYAAKLPSVLKDHGLLPDGVYVKVQHILSTDFHIPEDPVILVFEKKDSVSPEPFRQFIMQTLVQLQGIGGLTQVVSPLEKKGMLENNFAYALLAFEKHSYDMKPVLDDIHQRLPKHSDISVRLTGKSVVQADVNQASQMDLKKAELIGIPAAFLIIWLAFGGVVSAMIPIVIGIISVTGAMGIMYWLGTQVELSNFVLNVIPMVGLALSIDFALIMVSRFREELTRASAEQALVITIRTAGRAVMFSAACVCLGLMGIWFIRLPMFTTVAMGALVVVTVSVLLTLTCLPALLTVLEPSIRLEKKPSTISGEIMFWYSLSLFVMKRPVRMGLLASIVLISCLLPLAQMKLVIPDAASLPRGYDSRTAAEAYQTHFASPSTSHVYIVAQGRTNYFIKDDWLNAYALTQSLERDPDVLRVDSVFSSLRMSPEQMHNLFQKPKIQKSYEAALEPFVNDNRMLIHVTLQGSPASQEAKDWVRHWEQEGKSAEMRFLLGGESKYQQEVFDEIFDHMEHMLLFIFISQFVVLFVAFRSILIPLKTILMNLLSLGASFGILVWVFQEGRFGMEPYGIAIMIPVFIFGLAYGISMDYGVFLLSRISEVYRQTQDNERAVLVGLASTSRIITSAAAIMIAVTGPFAFGEVVGVKQLGIGIAAAIWIDATIIRMVLVPSLMKWLGSWNWRAPGWLK